MSKIKIAVVEDHEKLRKILIKNLSEYEEFQVIIDAANGQDFISKLELNKIVLVILDIQMPIMNGRETLIHIKKFHPHLKVIMFSSITDQIIVDDFLALGADSFIFKSDDFEKLIAAIHDLIN